MAKKSDAREGALVLCDADGKVVDYVTEPANGYRPFRLRHQDGRLYEHNGEDSMGRWVYLAVR